MLTMDQQENIQLIKHTLRVELLNGNSLLFGISEEEKDEICDLLYMQSDGEDGSTPVPFLFFQISGNRSVILNMAAVLRLTFCFDFITEEAGLETYYDNFDARATEDEDEQEEAESKSKWYLLGEEDYLPQLTIYHKGLVPEDDEYHTNPFFYNSLDEGDLADFVDEINEEVPLRQFINLIDDDGEETFIPLSQIILLEGDNSLFEIDTEEEKEEEEE